ncbi:TPA: hypothetical protein SLN67_001372 [Serratia marcescens]|nr:hypothetical protein [Serratia marcescens]
MKILYYPKNNGVNEYSNRFKTLLSKFGNIEGHTSKELLLSLTKFKFRKFDYAFVNWLESGLINKNGRISFYCLTKCYLKTWLFKLVSRRVVYVRHNFYPHAAVESDIKRARQYTDLLESLYDSVIVHSPVVSQDDKRYIPHPLYHSVIPQGDVVPPLLSYVFFGRITKYKKLDQLIAAVPKSVKLTIAGSCDDAEYLNYLTGIAGDNIDVRAGFLSDDEAHLLINNSQGLIIAHSDSDMIVSGSFFYSLSSGVRVISVESDFLLWAEKELGRDIIVCFKDIASLGKGLSELKPRVRFDGKLNEVIGMNFSDETICNALKNKIFD